MKYKTSISIMVLLSLISSFASHAASVDEVRKQIQQCSRSDGSSGCMKSVELMAFAVPNVKATRNGKVLTVQLKNKKISFSDVTTSDGSYDPSNIGYRYLGFWDDIKYHLINVGYAESGNFILISDDSGEQADMFGIPEVSPTKHIVISVAASESSDINEITIWKVTPQRLIQEFKYHLPSAEYALYDFMSWEGDSLVHLKKIVHSDEKYCAGSSFMTVDEDVVYKNGQWKRKTTTPLKFKCE